MQNIRMKMKACKSQDARMRNGKGTEAKQAVMASSTHDTVHLSHNIKLKSEFHDPSQQTHRASTGEPNYANTPRPHKRRPPRRGATGRAIWIERQGPRLCWARCTLDAGCRLVRHTLAVRCGAGAGDSKLVRERVSDPC